MLIISKVFTFLCLFCLCGNREYPGSFQNKAVSSSFKWVPNEVREKAFLKWKKIDFSSKLSLHMDVMLTIIKVFIIPFLFCLWEQEHLGNFPNKSVSSPFNWVSRYILFLPKLKGKERPFLDGGCKKGDHIVRLSPRALGCHERWKSPSFCEIWNNPTPPLFFYQAPLQISTARHGVLW